MTAARRIEPLVSPPDATVTVPGSKSITNRALVCAALAQGESVVRNVLVADDTDAMVDSITRLGIDLTPDPSANAIGVRGCGGHIPAAAASLDARLSGTTARFIAPVLALGRGRYRLDGGAGLRARPMQHLVEALRTLGATVEDGEHPGHLPLSISGGPIRGGAVTIPGHVSSQFLSGLLLAAPVMEKGLVVDVTAPLVSRPYVTMTTGVMRTFGAAVDRGTVASGGYRGCEYTVEPDASAASYLFAAAAITGGRVRVPGLTASSLQGDGAFVEVLERMGARVERDEAGTTVTGTGTLHGIDADLRDLSDTAPTLAAVAVFADGPTRVTGVGFIRRKETDRIGAVVAELRRCGIEAVAEADGFVVRPGEPRPATVETYGDHRMAMSFALLGLRRPGIEIADPGCVAKTFPGYWDALEGISGR